MKKILLLALLANLCYSPTEAQVQTTKTDKPVSKPQAIVAKKEGDVFKLTADTVKLKRALSFGLLPNGFIEKIEIKKFEDGYFLIAMGKEPAVVASADSVVTTKSSVTKPEPAAATLIVPLTLTGGASLAILTGGPVVKCVTPYCYLCSAGSGKHCECIGPGVKSRCLNHPIANLAYLAEFIAAYMVY